MCQICIKIHVSFNDLETEIFMNLEVDNEMSHSCGHYKHHISLQNANFSCVIRVYLRSFFFEHPVDVQSPPHENEAFIILAGHFDSSVV